MIVNSKKLFKDAKARGYAVPHFNVLDANYIKRILLSANKAGSPVIIGFSKNSAKYVGGWKSAVEITTVLDKDLNIKVPVIIHLDHGEYDDGIKALKAGFTSIMYDGSALPIKENIKLTTEIVNLAKKTNASVEAEVGSIGGEEEGIIGRGDIADISECELMKNTGIDSLAAGINTIHGKYPSDWTGIDFKVLENVVNATKLPIVLHGGSGIPDNQIKKAVDLGVSKMNVGTQLQVSYGNGVKKYFVNNNEKTDSKWYDPRKIINSGLDEVIKEVERIFDILNSKGKYETN